MGKKTVRSHRNNIMKSIKKTTTKTLPVVNKGLTTVGETAKDVAKASVPIIEKGVGVVYSTMATGLDLGIKGVKSVTNKSARNKSAKSRSRALAGGRRTRRRRTKHRY
jgi:hypothetical protein